MRSISLVVASAVLAGCGHDARTPVASPDAPGATSDSPPAPDAPPTVQVQVEVVTATTASGEALDLFPSVNRDGVIAYRHVPSLGTVEIATDTHGVVATVGAYTGPAFSISSTYPTSINATGAVAFGVLVDVPDTWAIFAGVAGSLTQIVDTPATSSLDTFFGIPVIDDGGAVAFGALRRDGSEALLLGDGGTPSVIAETGDQFVKVSGAGGPARNASGNVAFVADRGGGHGFAVFGGVAGNVHVIAGAEDGLTIPEVRPALDGGGDVAFLASDGTTSGIYVSDSSGLHLRLADQVSGGPALADDGALAYVALRAPAPGQQYASEAIVFVPPTGAPIMVTVTDQPLLDSTSQVFGLSPCGIVQQTGGYAIVFGVQLASGRTVIERARIVTGSSS